MCYIEPVQGTGVVDVDMGALYSCISYIYPQHFSSSNMYIVRSALYMYIVTHIQCILAVYTLVHLVLHVHATDTCSGLSVPWLRVACTLVNWIRVT